MQLIIYAATYIASTAGAGATAATIGSIVGYAATAAFIGYSIYTAINQSKKGFEGPRLGDLSVQTSTQGAPLPRLWGSMRISGNVIDGKKNEVVATQDVGGKLFGGNSQTTFEYFADFAVTLCEGPVVSVSRIWMNNKLWYSALSTASAATIQQSQTNSQFFKLYKGTATQLVDPTLEALHPVGKTPPYRHTAYIVFKALPLKNYGNAIPNVSIEVVTQGTETVGSTVLLNPPPQVTDSAVIDPINSVTWLNDRTAPANAKLKIYNYSGTLLDTIDMGIGSSHNVLMTYVPATGAHGALICVNANIHNSLHWYDPNSHLQVGVHVMPVSRSGPPIYNGSTDRVWVGSNSTGQQFLDCPINLPIAAVFAPGDANGVVGFGFSNLPVYVPGLELIVYKRNLALVAISAVTGLLKYSYGATTLLGYAVNTASGLLYFAEASADKSIRRVNLTTFVETVFSNVTPEPIFSLEYSPYTGSLYALFGRFPGNPTLLEIYIINPATMTITKTLSWAENDQYKSPLQVVNAQYLLSSSKLLIPLGGLVTITDVLLSTIVSDLCVESGFLVADIDVSQLTDLVRGFVRAEPMEHAAAMAPLVAAYFFDGQESDWILKFVKRNGVSVQTILEEKLAAREYSLSASEDAIAPLVVARMQETELPTSVTVRFMAQGRDYQQGSRIVKRNFGSTRRAAQIDLPIAMSATGAQKIARVALDAAWEERHRYQFNLPIQYIFLDPADVVTVVVEGTNHLIRLSKIDFGTPGLLNCDGVSDRVDNYTQESDTTDEDAFAVQEIVELVLGSTWVPLDIPILRDVDNNAAFYYAVTPSLTPAVGTVWPGAILFKSVDSGATYLLYDSLSKAAVVGSASTVLLTGPTTIWDEGNSVTVAVIQGTLVSDTELNVFAGANAAVLGSAANGWEIIQWKTATLNSPGNYTLSGLLRGRRGTEHVVGTHLVGDRFVALSLTTIDRTSMGATELGLSRLYKPVTVGQSLQDAFGSPFTNTGVGLKPFSPVQLSGSRVTSGDCTITWVRRTRLASEWLDSVDVPLGEETEKYDLEIYNGAVVVRTITDLTSPSRVYTAAEQTTDFGSTQSAIVIKVYQKSAIIGRGYPGSGTV